MQTQEETKQLVVDRPEVQHRLVMVLDKDEPELDKVEPVLDKLEAVQLLKVEQVMQPKAELEVKHEPELKLVAVQMRIKEGPGMRPEQATSNEIKVKQRKGRSGSHR